jgi:hypothetical protein
MPRLNGKHVSMDEYERWEDEQANRNEYSDWVSDEQYARLIRTIRMEYAKEVKARRPVAYVTEIAQGEGFFVRKLIEKHGFRIVVRALKAVSPKAKQLYEKYMGR